MNTQYFKYVIEVERTRSITQAADNLYMGQPNLSRAIKEMEEQLGFAIFERTSKGVVPTAKGNEFLNYAHNIVLQLEKMNRMARPSHGDGQIFNVSIPRASYITDALISFLKTLNPEQAVDVDFKETNSMNSIANVAEGRHNIAIIRYRLTNESYFEDYLKSKNLVSETLWEFRRKIITSKENPYLKNGLLDEADLSNCIEIVHGDTLVPYHNPGQQNQSKKTIKKIHIYERGSQFEMLSAIPHCYMWTSPIPQITLDRFNLITAECTKIGKRYKDVFIYQEGYKLSALDKRFLEKVYESQMYFGG